MKYMDVWIFPNWRQIKMVVFVVVGAYIFENELPSSSHDSIIIKFKIRKD